MFESLKTTWRQCNIAKVCPIMPHQYLQHLELGPFKKHIFITFKVNYRFNGLEKNGKIWCWEMLGLFMQLKKKINQITSKTRYRPGKHQSHQFVSTFYFSTEATNFCNIALSSLNITPTSPPGLNKTSHDCLSMSILGLAGRHAYKQTGKKEYRSFSSLLHMNLAKSAQRTQKKGYLAVTLLASSFPTTHVTVLWPWLIVFYPSSDLPDTVETIKLKILSFWGGEQFSINHCFLCNICPVRKIFYWRFAQYFCQFIFHRESQRFNPHHQILQSYTNLLQIVFYLLLYWPTQILSFPQTN